LNLAPLLTPRSIAVLGASERSALGRWILESLDLMGFTGAVWPINPKYGEILGRQCYPSLIDLPEPPDVTAICIGKAGVLENLRLLAERGGRAAVIYDSGFAELGEEGRCLQAEITGLCKEAGIALCGPNCMGVLNPSARSMTFKQTLRDVTGLAGNIGLVAQSGSVCGTMLADLRRFGFSLVVSCGNEAVVNTAAYIDFLVDDPATKVIATFTETVREPDKYVAALDRAAAAGKPVVVLKVGRSARARSAITSHTGGLAGESRVFSQLLAAHRAIEVTDLDEFTEVLAACQGARWPRGRNINVLTTSGGQAELILDIAAASNIELKPLPTAIKDRVEREVGHVTGDGNPLDAWGNGDARANMPPALAALDAHGGADSIVFCSSDSTDDQALGRPGRELNYAHILVEASAASVKPHYLMTMRPGVVHKGQIDVLQKAGVPVVCGTRQALHAIDSLATWMAWMPARRPAPACAPADFAPGRPTINEFDSKKLLAAAGIPVSRETLVRSCEEATAAADAIGYPIVLKVVADALPHKSEHGLVAVGLADETAVERAWKEMNAIVGRLGAPIQGWLVQEMVADGIEVFAGVSRDPQFGLSIAFGMGGIAIEVLEDFALRMLPLRPGDAEAMIGEIRGAKLLGKVRGGPAADVAALTRCLYALADFAVANADRLAEIDLNPIKVRAEGRGCTVVDALIVTR
jgi:acetate---CoA ligase (ADP-forming)